MKIFDKNKHTGGLMDEIRCDESSYLIWKWRPAGSQQSDSRRANSIRWGSSLRVKDGEVAVFVYNQKDGNRQDFIIGPFDQSINTSNFPILASIVSLAYDGGTPFQAEIYFINLARIIQVKFGVPFFDIYDPRFDDFGVPVAVRGTISFRIDDYREFIKLHRLNSFNLDNFQKQIRDAVTRYVKDAVANAPSKNNIPLVHIESKIAQINKVVEYDVSLRLKEKFGVVVSGVDISAIEMDKSSDNYAQLMAVTKELTAATLHAQTTTNIKNLHDRQRIEADNYQETLKIQREEVQYAQHKQTQTSNFAAYQTEAQTQVGVAGANALGQMGANGAGGVDLGTGGVGFNPTAMVAGMTLGGAIGQNIAGTMNHMMSGFNGHHTSGEAPPPIPTATYYVAVNGQSTGPFDIGTLKHMAATKHLGLDSLIWRAGMEEWTKAKMLDDLKELFSNSIPPIPSAE